jgi:hypothetical protein
MENSAWEPGLESEIPARLWPLVTVFREENASVSYPVAAELADLTGMKTLELAAFRPERLVVHALLVRVTADLSVSDGPNYEVLGINLRGMVDRIYTQYILPNMHQVIERFDAEISLARKFVQEQISTRPDHDNEQSADAMNKPSWFARFFTKPKKENIARPAVDAFEFQAIERWKKLAQTCVDPLEIACLDALIKTAGKVLAHRGRMVLDHAQLTDIVLIQVGNSHGAVIVDQFIEPFWQEALISEKYRLLPSQAKPVVMNVKGASASGKSTIRPRQRELAEKLNIPWEDFALISPDYWRKYLLDYDSLGDDFKYGAMLTGRELELIDKKLDRYMAQKATKGQMSHLLIDRFRFDSFALDIDRERDSRLLSRFGDVVYLFFMVTHPAETVERAWIRGQKTGRYKAVDDLLYHNVEAFTGMPSLFLSWVNSKDRKVHFEFLDNDVALGELPRTAAFGWNGTMTVLDVRMLINIDQYRTVNTSAQSPEDVFKTQVHPRSNEPGFIQKCADKISRIIFADQDSGEVYASVEDGKLVWCNRQYIDQSSERDVIEQILGSLGNIELGGDNAVGIVPSDIDIAYERSVTVGRCSQS